MEQWTGTKQRDDKSDPTRTPGWHKTRVARTREKYIQKSKKQKRRRIRRRIRRSLRGPHKATRDSHTSRRVFRPRLATQRRPPVDFVGSHLPALRKDPTSRNTRHSIPILASVSSRSCYSTATLFFSHFFCVFFLFPIIQSEKSNSLNVN